MSENFDIGPLTWVKDDIYQSLDSVLESIEALEANPQETSGMRFSKTHLYQASGALDMVGLEGCKLYCSYLEKLAGKLETKEVNVSSELTESFAKAIKTLKYYIQELLNGGADIPLRLYPSLEPVVAAMGETVDESELFFPDTSFTAPNDLDSKEFSDEEYTGFIIEQRLQYQKALLKWIQSKDEDALNSIHEALHNVTLAQHKPSVKTLWWSACAFTETLNLPEIADDKAAKKLCRKLDQELRQLAAGENKPNNNLLRDILYFVAISDLDKETVQRVKEVFLLDHMIDKQTVFAGAEISDDSEIDVIESLKGTLEELRDIWEEVSNSIDFEKIDITDDQALVDLDNVLITKFSDKLSENLDKTKSLSQFAVADLFDALYKASVVLREDKTKTSQAALIEVATALHLLDSALTHYQNMDADTIQHLLSETERLGAVETGLIIERAATSHRVGGLDRDTIAAVVKDINASLKVIEQSLDTYFRNPDDKSTLTLTPTPLKQMAAIFDMLNLDTPTNIVKACNHYIQYFQSSDYQTNQADFELVAESLSMVGLYAEEMPNVRPESSAALEEALERLTEALAKTGIEFVEEEEEPAGSTDAFVVSELDEQDADQEVAEAAEKVLDQALDEELQDIYLTEAEEVLAHVAQNLQALRVNATDQDALVEVRRSYHTLKGSGRTVGLTGQAEVAWKVESFLNGILDKKEALTAKQIQQLEEITAKFSNWAADLRTNNEAQVDQALWISKAEALSKADEGEDSAAAKEDKEEYVLISGKRKLGKQLYEIFLNESMQNLTIIEQDVANLTDNKTTAPEKQARHAVHTLASNALASGFTPMGDLCRALEYWLDAFADHWAPEYLELYSNVTKTIAKMWQSVSELKTPRTAQSLITLLNEASEKISQNKKEETGYTDPSLLDEDVLAEMAEEDVIEAEPTLEADEVESTEAPAIEEQAQVEEEQPVEEIDDIEEIVLSEAPEPEVVNFQGKLDTSNTNPELLEMFVEEADEILPAIGVELRAWKSKPHHKEHSDELQRSLHTLKGSARMANQTAIGDIAHGLEEYIIKVTKTKPTPDDFDSMFVELDKMASFFDQAAAEEAVLDKTVDTQSGEQAVEVIDEEAHHAVGRLTARESRSLRMNADVLDRLINEAGEVSIIRSRIDREMIGFKNASNDLTESLGRLRGYLRELEIEAETQMQSRMNILQEASESFDPLEFDRFTRLQELTRMIAESVNDVSTIQGGLMTNLDHTEAALQQQNRMNRELQQGLLGVRMLPFRQIAERLQRIVRQTARELRKSVDLVIEGEATEIDRGVLDRIGAPIEHLLRNAVAHGIETKTKRKAAKKPETGTIRMKISTANDEIHIVVTDDGAGVDLEKVKAKAIKNNLLDPNAEITEDTLLSVIFEPGFSTSDKVSQIAGRGVGLDVVRNDISALGGRIDMSSEANKGAQFDIFLPVTQSVAQVLMVRTGEDIYALPVAMVVQAQKIRRNDMVSAYADGKVTWADVNYPLHHLAKLLDHQEHELEDLPYASVLLLRSGAHTVALHIDEVIGNQEVVMKDIGSQLARVPGIVGSTVTGEGRIILIINPVQIANREVLSIGSVSVKNVKSKVKKTTKKKTRALVVDDSLTMRKVLGRLLEREGYEVLVAKDGMDAIELLQTNVPDIILTDIEMPRMDGFGLSRNIRDDARTANTPLIMISSRTADKHQNLAKEIGVDAFFGKPVQDEDLIAKMKELLQSKN